MNVIGIIFILLAIYGLASTAGIFAERSGVINLAIEGGMVFGALAYSCTVYLLTRDAQVNVGFVVVGVLVAIMTGVLVSMLLGLGAITLRGDQVIIGTAINIAAPVISLIALLSVTHLESLPTSGFSVEASQNFTGTAPWIRQMIIGFVVLVLLGGVWFLFDKTKFGLRLKAAGENPHALEAVGISVVRTRYYAVGISGAFMGAAGALCVAGYSLFAVFNSTVYGMGFIAIAILILGQWRVWGIMVGAIVFSCLFGFLRNYLVQLGDYSSFLEMVPYLVTLVLLPIISKFSRVPQSVGVPYQPRR